MRSNSASSDSIDGREPQEGERFGDCRAIRPWRKLSLASAAGNRYIPLVDTPIDDAAHRAVLDELTHALRALHKHLVDVVQAEYERVNGPVGGPVRLFQLLTGDEFFLWLHPMSALMAE